MATDWEQVFSFRCRQFRERRGLTQHVLATRMAELGVKRHFSAIAKIELRGQSDDAPRRVTLNEAVAIATALDVPLALMLTPPECRTCGDLPMQGFTCQECGS